MFTVATAVVAQPPPSPPPVSVVVAASVVPSDDIDDPEDDPSELAPETVDGSSVVSADVVPAVVPSESEGTYCGLIPTQPEIMSANAPETPNLSASVDTYQNVPQDRPEARYRDTRRSWSQARMRAGSGKILSQNFP